MPIGNLNRDEKSSRIPFGMPVRQGNPAYAEAPNKFWGREYFIIKYETCPDAIQRCLPPGLIAPEPIVKYEFMRMKNTSGFGSFHESGQVIPIVYNGSPGNYVHSMFLDSHPPIAGGREIWGFPKKLAAPKIEYDCDTLIGTLDYGNVRVATGTMGLKLHQIDTDPIVRSLSEPNFLVKSIPGVDGKPAICQLVRYYMTDISVDWAFDGPVALDLFSHAMAPINELPIKNILGGVHFIADLTLPYGDVVIDYLS